MAEKSKRIELIERPWDGLTITLEGLTPLLSNAPSEAMLDEMERKQTGETIKSRNNHPLRDPQTEWLSSRHRDDAGNDVWPTDAIHGAIVTAGMRFFGATGTLLRGSFRIPTDTLQIEGPPPHLRRDWGRLAGIGRTLGLIYRAEYWPWSLTVPILYDPSAITDQTIVRLLDRAGTSVGLGAWRPENRGTKGQFRLKAS